MTEVLSEPRRRVDPAPLTSSSMHRRLAPSFVRTENSEKACGSADAPDSLTSRESCSPVSDDGERCGRRGLGIEETSRGGAQCAGGSGDCGSRGQHAAGHTRRSPRTATSDIRRSAGTRTRCPTRESSTSPAVSSRRSSTRMPRRAPGTSTENDFWMDEMLARTGTAGSFGDDNQWLFTRGRAAFMKEHTPGTLGFAGQLAYWESIDGRARLHDHRPGGRRGRAAHRGHRAAQADPELLAERAPQRRRRPRDRADEVHHRRERARHEPRAPIDRPGARRHGARGLAVRHDGGGRRAHRHGRRPERPHHPAPAVLG